MYKSILKRTKFHFTRQKLLNQKQQKSYSCNKNSFQRLTPAT